MTGTARFFYSDKNDFPGIFYFTVGGGVNHYGYMTIQNGKLFFKDLWEENYSTASSNSSNSIKDLSPDKELILESKAVFEENRHIGFIALK